MVGMKITGFVGAFPIRDVRALPDNAAAQAVNFRPVSGALDGIRRKRPLAGLNANTRRVYRVPVGDVSNIVTASYWMQFEDPDTDVVRTPIVNDHYERYYWASPSTGLKFATKAQILAGNTGLALGVQMPGSGMSVTVTAGTGAIDPDTGENSAPIVTRSYVATFVDEFGSEGQPSVPVEASGAGDADWVLADIPQPVTQAGKPTITTIRIYRTITGTDGTTTFFQVADLNTGTVLYTDRLADTLVSGQKELGSTLWAAPPADIRGLALMPNGIFVGFFGNTLCFSENYQPHAWPVEYQVTVQHPIVGLGVYGNTCVVLTEGHPATVLGTQASTLALTTTDVALPCLSRHSIVSMPEGVYYASPQGLVLVSPAGIQLVTDTFIGRNLWENAYAPSTIQAVHVYGAYTAVCALNGVESGFLTPTAAGYSVINPLPQTQTGVIALDGFTNNGTRVGMDVWSGKPWLISDGALYEWMPTDTRREKYSWRSKEFQTPKPVNMGVAQLYFDDPEEDLELDEGEVLAMLRVWAGRRLVFEQDITGRSGEVIRLPVGFKSDIWQVEFEGALFVHSIQIAQSPGELRQQ